MYKLRGYLAITAVSIGTLLADLFQRLCIAGWVKIRPSDRLRLLTWWINLTRSLVTRPLEVIGGAEIPMPPRVIPSKPGTLIVMNHQSVLDIPMMVASVNGGYPRIVTRARYMRSIPLISHMVRLYQYPVVDPTANPKELVRALRLLARQAKESEVPIGLFPEGRRSRDGEIGPFRPRGLSRILAQRPWSVHVLVTDGYWEVARFTDFITDMSHIRGRCEHVATLEWEDPKADSTEFIEEIRTTMVDALASMRADPVAADS